MTIRIINSKPHEPETRIQTANGDYLLRTERYKFTTRWHCPAIQFSQNSHLLLFSHHYSARIGELPTAFYFIHISSLYMSGYFFFHIFSRDQYHYNTVVYIMVYLYEMFVQVYYYILLCDNLSYTSCDFEYYLY